jgi:transporter family protein
LASRTVFVFVFTLTFAAFVVPHKDLNDLKSSNWLWLSGSAVTTTLSWIFYYRAIKMGEVSTVALIDKGSVVVSVILALLVLHESMTAPKFLGSALIVGGLIVLARG